MSRSLSARLSTMMGACPATLPPIVGIVIAGQSTALRLIIEKLRGVAAHEAMVSKFAYVLALHAIDEGP